MSQTVHKVHHAFQVVMPGVNFSPIDPMALIMSDAGGRA